MRIEVRAAAPYSVHIDRGCLTELAPSLGDAARVAIIHPAPLAALVERIAASLDQQVVTVSIPDAEAAKTPSVLTACWDRLAEVGFTRSDAIVGLGGGTTTDLAGFVAATWLRGVRYVSIPTSVLGMVDAAVGGKTGINLAAGKNLVGAFYEPAAVLCDLDLLAGLPEAEVRSGLAEVVKCGFISDQEILRIVSEDSGVADVASDAMAELVARAVAVKAAVVSADLTERTSTGEQVGREALNYGHTLGHAIEAHEHFTWRHGPAISVGMVFIAEVSRLLLGLDASFAAEHRCLLAGLGLPVSYDAAAWPRLRGLMSLDKKSRGQALRLVGLRAQGRPAIIVDPDESVLEAAWATVSDAG